MSGCSCIDEMPLVSDMKGSECILLGHVVVIATCQNQVAAS